MECIEQIGLFLRGLEEFFLRKIAQIFHNFWGYFKKHHIDYFFSKFWIVFGHFPFYIHNTLHICWDLQQMAVFLQEERKFSISAVSQSNATIAVTCD